MGIAFIIIGAVGIFCVAVIFERTDIVVLSSIFTGLLIAGLIELDTKNKPKAIDVYRNNTELKITGTYKDSVFIPTDTTVIFKKSN